MSENMSYKSTVASFYRRSNDVEKYVEALEALAKDRNHLKLDEAEKCLAIGAGVGMNEIMLIKRFMPNLRKFTAVEPDLPSAAQLRLNVKHHLPDVECTVHDQTVQDYLQKVNHDSDSYNVIVMMQCLYYVDDGDRLLLFKTISDKLLDVNGSLVVSHNYQSVYPGDLRGFMYELDPTYEPPLAPVVKKELLETGFKITHEIDYFGCINCSDPDDELVGLFSHFILNKPVTKDEFQAAVWRFCPSEKLLIGFCLFVLKKL